MSEWVVLPALQLGTSNYRCCENQWIVRGQDQKTNHCVVCGQTVCCEKPFVVEDRSTGTDVCTNCGLQRGSVLDSQMAYDTSTITNEDDEDGDNWIQLKNRTSVSGIVNKSVRLNRNRHSKAANAVSKLCTSFNFATQVKVRAEELCHAVLRGNPHKLPCTPFMLGNICVYIAALEFKQYVPIDRLVNGIPGRVVRCRNLRDVLRHVDNQGRIRMMPPWMGVYNMVLSYINQLKLPQSLVTDELEQTIRYYVEPLHKSFYKVQARHLHAIAAAFLYRACKYADQPIKLEGKFVTQEMLAKHARVQEQSVSRTLSKISSQFPWGWREERAKAKGKEKEKEKEKGSC